MLRADSASHLIASRLPARLACSSSTLLVLSGVLSAGGTAIICFAGAESTNAVVWYVGRSAQGLGAAGTWTGALTSIKRER